MNYAGEARRAGLKIILWTLAAIAIIGGCGFVARFFGWIMIWLALGAACLWVLFALFTVYFFRDPEAKVPMAAGLVVAPGHGKVDVIEEFDDPQTPGARCRRVSIFLSVFDVHVQNAPVAGKIILMRHTTGQFLNAMSPECGLLNENLLLGIDAAETPGEKIGVRLIAGLIARRIVPFIKDGEALARGQRIGLIQFGSRVDLYLPLAYHVRVKLGDKVVGGETVMASKV